MSSTSDSAESRRPFDLTLAELPSRVQSVLRVGFSVIANARQESLAAMQEFSTKTVLDRRIQITEDQAKHFGLPLEDARSATSALSFLAYTISVRPEPKDLLIKGLVEAKLLDKSATGCISSIYDHFEKHKVALRSARESQRLRDQVLPVLDLFEVTVDVRLAFDGKRIQSAVPVAVAHIDSDALDQETWFQLSKENLVNLISELKVALDQIEAAELWLNGREDGGSVQ